MGCTKNQASACMLCILLLYSVYRLPRLVNCHLPRLWVRGQGHCQGLVLSLCSLSVMDHLSHFPSCPPPSHPPGFSSVTEMSVSQVVSKLPCGLSPLSCCDPVESTSWAPALRSLSTEAACSRWCWRWCRQSLSPNISSASCVLNFSNLRFLIDNEPKDISL